MTQIPVHILEFTEGGNTLWIHNSQGATVLRIKCTGKVKIERGCQNICAHSDLQVSGDIEICIPEKKRKK